MFEEHVFPDHARFVNDLVKAGGNAGIGSHGQLQGLGYHWELWSIQSGGMSNHDALKVATIHGAIGLGLDGDLLEKDPRRAIEKAVWGMLPKNRLGRQMLKKLKVYAGPDHPHQAQKATPFEIVQISQ